METAKWVTMKSDQRAGVGTRRCATASATSVKPGGNLERFTALERLPGHLSAAFPALSLAADHALAEALTKVQRIRELA